jgi:hypothetical protein
MDGAASVTAEIAVMNSEAVALAADSAVSMLTERGPKVYQSANKIFRLSKSAPVALMVYDSARFLGVPWETIAKTYREDRGDTSFPTLTGHADDFLSFLRGSRLLFPTQARDLCGFHTVFVLFSEIRDQIDAKLEQEFDARGRLTANEIETIVSGFIQSVAQHFAGQQALAGMPSATTVSASLRPSIAEARGAAFEQLPLSATDKRRLTAIAVAAFLKDMRTPVMQHPNRSGVVIAGFGSREIFPSVYQVVLESLFKNMLKGVDASTTSITALQHQAVIMPFAQREIVDGFLGGIEPEFESAMRDYWGGAFQALGQELASKLGATGQDADDIKDAVRDRCGDLMQGFDQRMGALRQGEYVSPILDAVAMLPKDELGAMAEALVNLTSFKRKVSVEAETVGGPIDVAVISKGDGLIWIKRKHYFDPAFNPQYFATRY